MKAINNTTQSILKITFLSEMNLPIIMGAKTYQIGFDGEDFTFRTSTKKTLKIGDKVSVKLIDNTDYDNGEAFSQAKLIARIF
jgi:hypothetical protein